MFYYLNKLQGVVVLDSSQLYRHTFIPEPPLFLLTLVSICQAACIINHLSTRSYYWRVLYFLVI